MIIILSPAKTFNRSPHAYDTLPVFKHKTHQLVQQLKTLTESQLMRSMHLSKSLAAVTHHDYIHFDTFKTAAIHGYYGYQYRHLDIDSLEHKVSKKDIKSIYILSGLYGLLKAYDGISPYRLEMKDKTIRNLYKFWQPSIESYIKKHFNNELIYNLASEEYGQLIKHIDHVITIQFYELNNGQLTIHAMEAKKMRGLLARYLIMYPHVDVKGIKIEGYTFSLMHSTPTVYTFVRSKR